MYVSLGIIKEMAVLWGKTEERGWLSPEKVEQ